MKNRLKKLNYANLFAYAVLILISYQFVYPMIRMITISLMSTDDILNPMVNMVPQTWSFGNLRVAARVLNWQQTMFNSIWFSGTQALGQTLVAATTGFALARYNFRFKRFWFAMIMVAFILPAPVVLVPRSILFQGIQNFLDFQLIGTIWPQIAIAFTGQGIFSAILILIFYNFTKMIPPSLDEAAAIDGANSFKIFYHIILKLSITTLLVVFLFSFVWNWNETFVTSTFLRGNVELIPGRLANFNALFGGTVAEMAAEGGGVGVGQEVDRVNEAFQMAGTFISIIPLFVLYLIVQKQFIKGIENTGITGV